MDLPEVLAIERTSYVNPWTAELFLAEMAKSHAGQRVARLATGLEAGTIVGYICYWLVVPEIEIVNLAVHAAHRGCGRGRKLLLHALGLAYNKGVRLATLEVRRGNEAARFLYERLGFRTVAERANYYAEYGDAALILQLQMDHRWWHRWQQNCSLPRR
ncbi:MAG: ribosomal protein S18-alanine N-acetyltransferase [Deltaproteobacteria bacterium]|nr:ribosomal protein S18-alanine N-acetyltransferase [Deltaproteobacteria bacterium]MBW2070513.1 ribosomal protein S18-alanine N-acetyltransferase [Deltaproteobacteria bacterium]